MVILVNSIERPAAASAVSRMQESRWVYLGSEQLKVRRGNDLRSHDELYKARYCIFLHSIVQNQDVVSTLTCFPQLLQLLQAPLLLFLYIPLLGFFNSLDTEP